MYNPTIYTIREVAMLGPKKQQKMPVTLDQPSDQASSSSTGMMLVNLDSVNPEDDAKLAEAILQHCQEPSTSSLVEVAAYTDVYVPVTIPVLYYYEYLEHYDMFGDFLSLEKVLAICYAKSNVFERSHYIQTHVGLLQWFARYPYSACAQPLLLEIMNIKFHAINGEIISLFKQVIENHLADPLKRLSLDGLFNIWCSFEGILEADEFKIDLAEKLARSYKEGNTFAGYDKDVALSVYSIYVGYLIGTFLNNENLSNKNHKLQLSILDKVFYWHYVIAETTDINAFIQKTAFEHVQTMMSFLVKADLLYRDYFDETYAKLEKIDVTKKHVANVVSNTKLSRKEHAKQILGLVQLLAQQKSEISALSLREKWFFACLGFRKQFFEYRHSNNAVFKLSSKIRDDDRNAIVALGIIKMKYESRFNSINKEKIIVLFSEFLSSLSNKLKSLYAEAMQSEDQEAIQTALQSAEQLQRKEENEQAVKTEKMRKNQLKKQKAQQEKLRKEWEELQAKRRKEQESNESALQIQHTKVTQPLENNTYYKRFFLDIANGMHAALPRKSNRIEHTADKEVYDKFASQVLAGIRALPSLLKIMVPGFNEEIKKENVCDIITDLLNTDKKQLKKYFKNNSSDDEFIETLWKISLGYFGIAEYYLLLANKTFEIENKSVNFVRAKDNYQRSLNVLNVLINIVQSSIQDNSSMLNDLNALHDHHQCICEILKSDINDIHAMIIQRLEKLNASREAAKMRYQQEGKNWHEPKPFDQLSSLTKERIALEKVQPQLEKILQELNGTLDSDRTVVVEENGASSSNASPNEPKPTTLADFMPAEL